jgi:hypothetical protein
MKLLGRDIDARALLHAARERLEARGIREDALAVDDEPEPLLEPLSFLVRSLEENEDPTVGLPIATHRTGLGQGVVAAKWLFRRTCQLFINEALGRQRLFNSQVRDLSAQLAAEVIRLRARVEALEAEKASKAEKTAKPLLPPRPSRRTGKARR